ncbi:flagellar basal body P-ring formation chaperone FlgA [Phreatobacter sp.]|uniref:flagellar basal body P-ring formation chaperone FlgA n=1 Tax=Phreatobacter sp. TaxID=1966341 RepID=UPI003F6FBD88
MRRVRSLALIAALVAGLAPAAAAEPAPRLRPHVSVAADIVRLGDFVEHAGRFADVALFRAPDLGHTGTVPAWQIVDAARRAGLADVAADSQAEVVVTRAARIIPLADMEEKVAGAVALSLGVTDTSRIRVAFEAGVRPIAVEPDARGTAIVVRLDHDARTGRFEIVLAVPGSDRSARAGGFVLTGHAHELIDVVVPARMINRGEVLKASDLTVERRARHETHGLTADTVMSLPQAAGLAARRPLPIDRPFRTADLMKPELVERNSAVLITFETPGMMLSLRGRALEAGAEGDVIQVQNLQTQRTLQAKVIGSGRVSIIRQARPVALVRSAPTP